MKVLELFSGTHSIGVVCKDRNYDVVSLDRDISSSCKLNPEYESTHHIQIDILEWDYKQFPKGHFDIITASPVCTWWSHLRKSWYGRKMKGHDEPFCERLYLEDIDKYGKPMVDRVFEIIEYYEPTYWWIENPKSSMMWKYIREIRPQYTNHHHFDYCMFSNFGYKKPTTFLSNIPNMEDKRCNKKCNNIVNNRHDTMGSNNSYVMVDGRSIIVNSPKTRQYASKHKLELQKMGGGSNRLERYRIPKQLIEYLFDSCLDL